jgi:hypothetical protein
LWSWLTKPLKTGFADLLKTGWLELKKKSKLSGKAEKPVA